MDSEKKTVGSLFFFPGFFHPEPTTLNVFGTFQNYFLQNIYIYLSIIQMDYNSNHIEWSRSIIIFGLSLHSKLFLYVYFFQWFGAFNTNEYSFWLRSNTCSFMRIFDLNDNYDNIIFKQNVCILKIKYKIVNHKNKNKPNCFIILVRIQIFLLNLLCNQLYLYKMTIYSTYLTTFPMGFDGGQSIKYSHLKRYIFSFLTWNRLY